jgi:uncharacterized protein (UPF0332 family)
MAYHDDLLNQALQLAHGTPPTQACLRRAVSSAYYAVFHLLIAEAVSNWNNVGLRAALTRAFDRGTMKTASNRLLNARDFPFTGEDPVVAGGLRLVARTFVQLQEDRHFADYNLTRDVELTEALSQVKSAEKVFTTWPTIRTAQITQEYLVSLVVRQR